jgi:hypothetical protein
LQFYACALDLGDALARRIRTSDNLLLAVQA